MGFVDTVREWMPDIDLEIDLAKAKQLVLRKAADELKEDWKPFWKLIARNFYAAEKAWKEQQNPLFKDGYLRLEWAKQQAITTYGSKLTTMQRWAVQALLELVDGYATELVRGFNESIGRDWVAMVEDWEHEVAVRLERLVLLDLDEDGLIGDSLPGGAAPAPLCFLLGVGLLLGLDAAPARALGRQKLHDHYTPGAVAPLAPPARTTPQRDPRTIGRREPLHQHYVPRVPPPTPARRQTTARPLVAIDTWVGHQPARGGIDTGIGACVVSGSWHLGVQAARDRLGPCVGWRRFGVNCLWNPRDGSWEPGLYVAPIRW